MLRINYEKLIEVADNYFVEREFYEKAFRTGNWHSLSEKDQTRRYELYMASWEAVQYMAAVIGADVEQIISLTRSIRKWYEKTHWRKMPRYDDYTEQIERYIGQTSGWWRGHYQSTGRKIKA